MIRSKPAAGSSGKEPQAQHGSPNRHGKSSSKPKDSRVAFPRSPASKRRADYRQHDRRWFKWEEILKVLQMAWYGCLELLCLPSAMNELVDLFLYFACIFGEV